MVLDFSRGSFRTADDLSLAVHAIYRVWREGSPVVAVASAAGPVHGASADELLERAEQLGLPPDRTAATLLTSSLHRSGIPATLAGLALATALPPNGRPLDASDLRLLVFRIEPALSGVVVVPGFGDHSRRERTAGGLASALRARYVPVDAVDPSVPIAALPPLRVALLGCGTVGGGVLSRLLALPEQFEIAGVAVRDRAKPRLGDPPAQLFGTDWRALLARPADVLVELAGGHEPAVSAIRAALAAGRHVVTANKALLARDGGALERLAASRGVSLRYSAAVGGALPALEAVRRAARHGRVRAVSGVLNGTTTFVLDRLAGGSSLVDAVAAAIAAGYAEADPTLDLDGTDAAQKLCLLARAAWGVAPRPERVMVRGIGALPAEVFTAAREQGRVVRLVATCVRTRRRLTARVEPVALAADDPLAVTGAGNALRVDCDGGESIQLAAQGAGRWPTTEAVMADLFDLWRERSVAAATAAGAQVTQGEAPLGVTA